MADRKVKLIIEIDDKDVKATEASLHRLGLATKKVGDTGADMDRMTGSMTKASFAGNLLADAVQRVPELLISAGKAAFDLAVNFAETGKQIDRARELTGLSTEALSALESQAKRSGLEFNAIGEGFKQFTKNIGDANKDLPSAVAKMEALFGKNWKERTKNLDDAFRDVLKRIAGLPDEISRGNAAMDAFGEQGYKLLPFIRSFGGDLDALTKKAKELGLTFSEEDVRAAKEFDEAFKNVQDRARAVGIAFGKELAEPIGQALNDINSWLNTNKGQVSSWAEAIAGSVHYAAQQIKKETLEVEGFMNRWERFGIWLQGDTLWGWDPMNYGPRIEYLDKRLKEINVGYGAAQRAQQVGPSTYSGFSADDDALANRVAANAPASKKADRYGTNSDDKPGRGGSGSKPKTKLPAFGSLKHLVISTGNPQWDAWFVEYGNKFGVDPNLLVLQMGQESSGKVGARSNKGAMSLMQLMPGTARRMGVTNPYDPEQSIMGGSKYMGMLLSMFGGDYRLALAGYNAGEGAVMKYGNKIPPYKETQDYVKKITGRYINRVGGKSSGLSYGTFNPERELEAQSDAVTKAERDRVTPLLIESYKKLGLLPDADLIADFHRLLVEEARKGQGIFRTPGWNEKTQGPDPRRLLQPTREEVAKQFSGLKDPMANYDFGTIYGRNPLTAGEQRFQSLDEQLGLKERLTELDNKRKFFAQDLLQLSVDYSTQLQEQQADLVMQSALLDRRNLQFEAANRLEEERLGLTREIGDLQIEMMNYGQNDALKIQAAYMRDVLELRDRELNAVIAVNRAQLQLSKSMEISNNQIRAGVYEHLAQQKTVNQGIIDGINGTYDAILGRINEPLDKLNSKTQGLLSLFTEPAKAMQAQALNSFVSPIIDKFFPGFEDAKNPMLAQAKRHTDLLEQIAANTGGLPAGYNPTAGSAIRNIFSGSIFGGGRGNGPGGTPNFNPNVGQTGSINANGEYVVNGNQQQGGLGGMFNAGSLAMLSNPVTAAVLGMQLMMSNRKTKPFTFGLIGKLFGFGKDNATQKLKDAAASQFGINVRDKSVLQSLKSLGEGMFGRGQVGNNAIAVVRSEEGQNILRAYAESSGQSGLKIDRLNYGNPNWSGNQFRGQFGGFRANGGSVTAGRAYVVGERRAEMFVPHVNGTIMPAVPSVSTTDAKVIAALTDAVYELRNEVSKFSVKGAGVIVREGADEAGDAIIGAANRSFVNDWRQVESNRRSTF